MKFPPKQLETIAQNSYLNYGLLIIEPSNLEILEFPNSTPWFVQSTNSTQYNPKTGGTKN